jgi:hypothetical protein
MEEKDLIKKIFLKERLVCNGEGGRSLWRLSDLDVGLTMERQRFRVSFFTVGGGREMMDVEIIISFF